jgi:hypothetical protein
MSGLPVRPQPPAAVEEMYQAALKCIEEERWSEANRHFQQINRLSPGYADIGRHWQHSVQQEQLAAIYGRLTENWAQRRWDRVLTSCQEILRITPEYKDTTRYYAEVCRMLAPSATGAQINRPPPDSLPGQALRPSKPATLPGGQPRSQKPDSLPGGQGAKKQDKPPTLPG